MFNFFEKSLLKELFSRCLASQKMKSGICNEFLLRKIKTQRNLLIVLISRRVINSSEIRAADYCFCGDLFKDYP